MISYDYSHREGVDEITWERFYELAATLTEALIQKGMDRLMHGRTSFVIAHRLSTIKRADRILVIEAGRIAEMGTHSELLRHRGHYYELYTKQFRRDLESEYGLGKLTGLTEPTNA